MIRPDYLKKGDTIGIVSTARKVKPEDISPAVKMLETWGYNVKLGENLFSDLHQFAGNDFQRAGDLQSMCDNPEIKAILFARGGYGTVRLLPILNLHSLKNNPKWFLGYSDISVLHSYLNNCLSIESIHCPMAFNFTPERIHEPSVLSIKKALSGNLDSYSFENHHLNKTGIAEGEIIGGNLSIIYSLSGTPYEANTDGKILFLEDLDEYLYHIDRMMWNLKLSGKLQNLAGLIIGGMSEMKDNDVPFGKSAIEIISESVKGYNFPVCYNFPAGHITPNMALYFGRKIRMIVNNLKSEIDFFN